MSDEAGIGLVKVPCPIGHRLHFSWGIGSCFRVVGVQNTYSDCIVECNVEPQIATVIWYAVLLLVHLRQSLLLFLPYTSIASCGSCASKSAGTVPLDLMKLWPMAYHKHFPSCSKHASNVSTRSPRHDKVRHTVFFNPVYNVRRMVFFTPVEPLAFSYATCCECGCLNSP